jgi:hypothetical protein
MRDWPLTATTECAEGQRAAFFDVLKMARMETATIVRLSVKLRLVNTAHRLDGR